MESSNLPCILTDGTNVLWTTSTFPSGFDGSFGYIYLQTPNERIALDTNTYVIADTSSSYLRPPADSFAMNGGWVAFPRFSPDLRLLTSYDIWRRSPDGVISRVALAPSYIKAMQADGALLITGTDATGTISGIIFVPPAGPAKLISNNFGDSSTRYFVSGSQFYALTLTQTGMGLFLVEVDADPFGLGSPTFNPATGTLSYDIVASEPGTFALQRTTNFLDWTTIATNTLTNGIPNRFETPTPPAFFRLQKL
jgi:hypothetical protein